MKVQIKYDFSRCNNLSFNIKKEGQIIEGYLKVKEDEVYMHYKGENSYNAELQINVPDYVVSSIADFIETAQRFNLNIMPRNPETYDDWKVEDVIKYKNDEDEILTIIAKLGEVIFAKDTQNYVYTLSAKYVTENYELVLTDYEQELLKILKDEPVCPFKTGDKILGREKNNFWKFDHFSYYDGNFDCPYVCYLSNYDQCIPLNEHTWKLLGTTDEYKEKE